MNPENAVPLEEEAPFERNQFVVAMSWLYLLLTLIPLASMVLAILPGTGFSGTQSPLLLFWALAWSPVLGGLGILIGSSPSLEESWICWAGTVISLALLPLLFLIAIAQAAFLID